MKRLKEERKEGRRCKDMEEGRKGKEGTERERKEKERKGRERKGRKGTGRESKGS